MTWSNEHKLEEIWSELMTPQTTYENALGFYSSLEEIKPMMRKFFSDFEGVHWETDNIFTLPHDSAMKAGIRKSALRTATLRNSVRTAAH